MYIIYIYVTINFLEREEIQMLHLLFGFVRRIEYTKVQNYIEKCSQTKGLYSKIFVL